MSADGRMATEAARLKGEKLPEGKSKTALDTNRPSHGRTKTPAISKNVPYSRKFAVKERVHRVRYPEIVVFTKFSVSLRPRDLYSVQLKLPDWQCRKSRCI